MAVSKRLRFEIFRRDIYTCHYCGASAPDVVLTVDHILPKTLGGTDLPDNLVTACTECNSGKSSTQPDRNLVSEVRREAERWQAEPPRLPRRLDPEEDEITADYQGGWCEAYATFGHKDIPQRALEGVVDGSGRWGRDLRWVP
jgi:hypothetical protein